MLGKLKINYILIGIVIVLVLGIIYVPKMTGKVIDNKMTQVKLTTNYGDIVIELYDDMPITAGNFKDLVEKGVYDGVIFHRVIDGFMIQGGDPTGTGYGDPKIKTIPDTNRRPRSASRR